MEFKTFARPSEPPGVMSSKPSQNQKKKKKAVKICSDSDDDHPHHHSGDGSDFSPGDDGAAADREAPTAKHTFVNEIVSLLEDIDKWTEDEDVTKLDMARDARTRLLQCMRAGMVHPFTTFYSLEAATVLSGAKRE